MLHESVVVVGCCVCDWADLAGLVEVDGWVAWWEDGVGGAYYRADLGGHGGYVGCERM